MDSCNWCFTLTGHTAADETLLRGLDCVYMVFGRGTHPQRLQGFVQFHSSRGAAAVQGLIHPSARWEPAHGNAKHAAECCKRDSSVVVVFERGEGPFETHAAYSHVYQDLFDMVQDLRGHTWEFRRDVDLGLWSPLVLGYDASSWYRPEHDPRTHADAVRAMRSDLALLLAENEPAMPEARRELFALCASAVIEHQMGILVPADILADLPEALARAFVPRPPIMLLEVWMLRTAHELVWDRDTRPVAPLPGMTGAPVVRDVAVPYEFVRVLCLCLADVTDAVRLVTSYCTTLMLEPVRCDVTAAAACIIGDMMFRRFGPLARSPSSTEAAARQLYIVLRAIHMGDDRVLVNCTRGVTAAEEGVAVTDDMRALFAPGLTPLQVLCNQDRFVDLVLHGCWMSSS